MTELDRCEAKCACGQLRLVLGGSPDMVSTCHCLDCQRRTGSLFGASAVFKISQRQESHGKTRCFKRVSDRGSDMAFHFCPACGSTVYWFNSALPDAICVAVGAFADPEFPRPIRTIWTRTQHRWLEFPADIRTFEVHPAAPRPAD